MRHVLTDGTENLTTREMSEGVADDLVLRGIIYRVSSWYQGVIYKVHENYSHLQEQDLDALCDGVEVAEEVLNPEDEIEYLRARVAMFEEAEQRYLDMLVDARATLVELNELLSRKYKLDLKITFKDPSAFRELLELAFETGEFRRKHGLLPKEAAND
jgi:hypothetical protein